jgi:anti-anti-sigma factor
VRRRRRDGISTSVDGVTGFVELHGEVDITDVAQIERAVSGLIDHPVERIVVDFTDTDFADSKAIEALMRAGRAAGLAGLAVAAAGAHDAVARAIEVCGLEHAMPLYATRADALAATGAPTAREQ